MLSTCTHGRGPLFRPPPLARVPIPQRAHQGTRRRPAPLSPPSPAHLPPPQQTGKQTGHRPRHPCTCRLAAGGAASETLGGTYSQRYNRPAGGDGGRPGAATGRVDGTATIPVITGHDGGGVPRWEGPPSRRKRRCPHHPRRHGPRWGGGVPQWEGPPSQRKRRCLRRSRRGGSPARRAGRCCQRRRRRLWGGQRRRPGRRTL